MKSKVRGTHASHGAGGTPTPPWDPAVLVWRPCGGLSVSCGLVLGCAEGRTGRRGLTLGGVVVCACVCAGLRVPGVWAC